MTKKPRQKRRGESCWLTIGHMRSRAARVVGVSGLRVPSSGFVVPAGVMTLTCWVTTKVAIEVGKLKNRAPAVRAADASRNQIRSAAIAHLPA
jgi:hypothetical protein